MEGIVTRVFVRNTTKELYSLHEAINKIVAEWCISNDYKSCTALDVEGKSLKITLTDAQTSLIRQEEGVS